MASPIDTDEQYPPLGRTDRSEVDTLEKLASLNQADIVRGYLVGFDKVHGAEIPIGENRAFLHGWLNAQVDRGRMKSSSAQMKLAAAYVARPR